MHNRKFIFFVVIVCGMLAIAGCSPAAQATEAPMAAPAATQAPAMALPFSSDSGGGAPAAPASAGVAPEATAGAVAQTGTDNGSSNIVSTGHMIVKNGNIKLLVKDSDRALDGIMQIVGDTQSYIISSRMWYQDYFGTNYKYATLTIGIPVDQFENALVRLRGLSVRVEDENASGDDVTNQYVDLQSRLANLEATRDRIKGFLDQARDVNEALVINQQLSDVEAQIEQIQGKMNSLSTRSAFSTLTVDIEPVLPTIVTTPTPTPTPVPTETLIPWNPGKTTLEATNVLASTYHVIIDFLIWIFVVVVPVLAPPILIIWLIVWLLNKRSKPAAKA